MSDLPRSKRAGSFFDQAFEDLYRASPIAKAFTYQLQNTKQPEKQTDNVNVTPRAVIRKSPVISSQLTPKAHILQQLKGSTPGMRDSEGFLTPTALNKAPQAKLLSQAKAFSSNKVDQQEELAPAEPKRRVLRHIVPVGKSQTHDEDQESNEITMKREQSVKDVMRRKPLQNYQQSVSNHMSHNASPNKSNPRKNLASELLVACRPGSPTPEKLNEEYRNTKVMLSPESNNENVVTQKDIADFVKINSPKHFKHSSKALFLEKHRKAPPRFSLDADEKTSEGQPSHQERSRRTRSLALSAVNRGNEHDDGTAMDLTPSEQCEDIGPVRRSVRQTKIKHITDQCDTKKKKIDDRKTQTARNVETTKTISHGNKELRSRSTQRCEARESSGDDTDIEEVPDFLGTKSEKSDLHNQHHDPVPPADSGMDYERIQRSSRRRRQLQEESMVVVTPLAVARKNNDSGMDYDPVNDIPSFEISRDESSINSSSALIEVEEAAEVEEKRIRRSSRRRRQLQEEPIVLVTPLVMASKNMETEKAVPEMESQTEGSDVENFEVADTPAERITVDEPVSKMHETPRSSRATRQRPQKEYSISQWCIVPCRSTQGILVEGIMVGGNTDEFWHSTSIVERKDQKTVATKSGSLYKLMGNMDVAAAKETGFTAKIIQSFKRGFPASWREIISEFYRNKSSRNPAAVKTATPVRKSRFKSARLIPSTPASQIIDSTRFDLGSMDKTRSGRTVKKPLAWWAGERVKFNFSTDSVEIASCTNDSLNNTTIIDPDKVVIRMRKTVTKGTLFPGDRKSKLQSRHREEEDKIEDSQLEISYATTKSTKRTSSKTAATARRAASQKDQIDKGKGNGKKQSNRTKASDKTDKPGMKGNKGSLKRGLSQQFSSQKNAGHSNSKKRSSSTSRKGATEKDVYEIGETTTETGTDTDNPSLEAEIMGVLKTHRKRKANSRIVEKIACYNAAASKQCATARNRTTKRNVNYKEAETDSSAVDTDSDVAGRGRGKSKKLQRNSTEEDSESIAAKARGRKGGSARSLSASNKENKTSCSENEDDSKVHKVPKKRNASKSQKLSTTRAQSPETDVLLMETNDKKRGKKRTVSKPALLSPPAPVPVTNLQDVSFDLLLTPVDGKSIFANKRKSLSGNKKANPKAKKKEKWEYIDFDDYDLFEDPDFEVSKLKKQRPDPQDESWSEEDSKRKPGKARSKKRQKSSEKDHSNPDNSQTTVIEGEGPWQPTEIARLTDAVASVSADQELYWENIARCVGTRDAQDCQTYYHRDAEQNSSKKKEKPKKPINPAPAELTAKVGTMKRKRQLRELVAQFDEGHEDDLFDSTPFKKTKITVASSLADEEGDDDLLMKAPTPGGLSRFQTPVARYNFQPMSERKTPCSSLVSPGFVNSVNRNSIDEYINRWHKGKKGRVLKNFNDMKKTPKRPGFVPPKTLGKALGDQGSQMFEVNQASDNDENSEDEEDYYWSGEED